MARNWKVGEALAEIKAGNKEAILDIGRRFPLFTVLAAQTNDAGVELLSCVPDYCTARKMESVLKTGVNDTEDTDSEDEEVEEAAEEKAPKEKPVEKAKPAKKDTEVEDDLDSKSAKELFDMCKKAGIKVEPKQGKSVYIKALKKADKAKAVEAEEADDWGAEDEAPKAKPVAKGKSKAKPAKEEEADDEDWDI